MAKPLNRFDNDVDDIGNIDSILKEFELNLPDEDDAFFDIELESLESYLENSNKKKNGLK